jgi:hypothetical protein
VENVISEATKIARTHDLKDRINIPTESSAFITVKDHKDTFLGRVERRSSECSKGMA